MSQSIRTPSGLQGTSSGGDRSCGNETARFFFKKLVLRQTGKSLVRDFGQGVGGDCIQAEQPQGEVMQVEKRSVAELSMDPANARKHNERNIEAIIASLRRFGQQKPIVIDKSNVVRAGNGTLEAAKRLGWDKIDCVVTNLESSDATAYAIADNRTAELAEWDSEILAAELESLQSDGLLEAAGFTDEELAEMLKQIDFQPGTEGEQGKLDQLDPKIVKCPKCQTEFDCREQV